MNINIFRSLLIVAAILRLAALACVAQAQTTFGLEFGAGRDAEIGTMKCDCGATFTGGSGNSLNIVGVYEISIAHDISLGTKIGFAISGWSSSSLVADTGIVYAGPATNQYLDTVSLTTRQIGSLKMSSFKLMPFIEYEICSTGLFVQVAPNIAYLSNTSFEQTRQLLSDTIVLHDGTKITNLTLTNGSSSEKLRSGAISRANSLLLSAIFSAGYKFDVFGFSVAPLLSYELPISNVQSNQNWKLSSWYGSVAFLFAP